MFKKMFGQTKKNDKDQAMNKLKQTQELILKKSQFLEKKIAEEHQLVVKYGMKQKNLALKALSHKKRLEAQLRKLDGTLTIIEEQMHNLENVDLNVEVFNVLKSSSSAMKTANKNTSIDDVHKVMDSIAEQREIANEISDAISKPELFGIEYDEDELLAELERECMENQMLDVGSVSDLPEVPATTPLPSTSKTKVSDDSKKELDELLAWAE